jgi:hypothetical protein
LVARCCNKHQSGERETELVMIFSDEMKIFELNLKLNFEQTSGRWPHYAGLI